MLQLKLKTVFSAILLGGLLILSQAQASNVTIINDTWVNWPGFTTSPNDEIGNPKLEEMRVTVSDSNILEKVELVWKSNSHTRIEFDSLFINSYDLTTTNGDWDDWDYLIHDGGNTHTGTGGSALADVVNGNVPGNGLWEVQANYAYTTVKTTLGRENNPNGIDADYLENSQVFSPQWDDSTGTGILTYDLASLGIMSESGFFIAYSPYCANDVIGGTVNPVPVPATVWLFASGLTGLISFRRRSAKFT